MDGDSCLVARDTLFKACKGPDAQTATAAIAQKICDILDMEYNEAMSVQFLLQGVQCAMCDEIGRHGIYTYLIEADTIVLETKGV